MNLYETLDKFFFKCGDSLRIDSAMTLKDHSLWSGYQAIVNFENSEIIVASLLHDIGHFLLALDSDATDYEKDQYHASHGASWLSRWLPASVTKPIELHVLAKRYLYTRNTEYRHGLSPQSLASLNNQGFELSKDEMHSFEDEFFFKSAMSVRKYDDWVYSGEKLPDFSIFRSYLKEFE